MTRRGCIIVALAFAFGIVTGTAAQQRDGARPAAGTASVSGVVLIDGPSKQPARRVRVTLTNLGRTSTGQTTTTDDNGAFAFVGLPASRYEVRAFRNGYLPGSYGASRPDRPGTPIVVKDGERITRLAIAIAPGGVITGQVRDTRGRPVPGVNVRVLKLGYSAVTGERTVAAASIGSVGVTDDRGEYRAFGLPPGDYLVLVPAPSGGRIGGPGFDDIRPLTSAEVQQAVQAARATASGGVAPAVPASLSYSSASARVNYSSIFHPGVTEIGSATTITLGLSQERTGIDITMQFTPASTVTGRVTAPTGALPPRLSVRLVPAGAQVEMLVGAGIRGLSLTPQPDGSFAFAGVPAGAYSVKAITAAPGGGRGAPTNVPVMWAAADVHLSGQDVDVPLMLQPGIVVNGRVVFEGAPPAPADLQSLSIKLLSPASAGLVQMSPIGNVDATGRVTLLGVVPDAYRIAATWGNAALSDTWVIKASVANGRESLDAPLVVSANETLDWTLTFSDKPSTLSGHFQDRSGRAATDYYILVFPSDRKYWTPGSRRVRMTRPGTDGAFSVKGLPGDEYVIVALTDVEPGEWNDAAFLGQLAASGVKVQLRDGETTTQDLRIGG